MTYSKRLIKILSIACMTVAIMCVSGSCWSLSVPTDLIGGIGTVHVVADVTQTGSVYNYVYTLEYVSGNSRLHAFGVGNDNGTDYFGAWAGDASVGGNTVADSAFNSHTTYDPENSSADVAWYGDETHEFTVGQTRQFGYYSYAPPMTREIMVYAWVLNNGDGADGETLGMGNAIPEPGSILALGFGLAGLAPFVLRRRR